MLRIGLRRLRVIRLLVRTTAGTRTLDTAYTRISDERTAGTGSNVQYVLLVLQQQRILVSQRSPRRLRPCWTISVALTLR